MTTIYTFAQSAIEEAQNAGRYGTANLYTSAIKSFRKFTGDRPLTFKELTPGLIKKYEESLLQKGRRHNTISAYMRMLRSIFNQAYVQGIPDATSADELFRFVFTGYEPTTKRAISPALIRRLSQLKLEQHPHLCFSRDLFLLSFYLRGIPFVDLVYLRKTDMRHNTIYYYRHKTRQSYRSTSNLTLPTSCAGTLTNIPNPPISYPYFRPPARKATGNTKAPYAFTTNICTNFPKCYI